MSWMTILIGKPEEIVAKLHEHSASLDGQSKEEFDAALPHIIGVVEQNYSEGEAPTLKLDASGHGYENNRTCLVSVQQWAPEIANAAAPNATVPGDSAPSASAS